MRQCDQAEDVCSYVKKSSRCIGDVAKQDAVLKRSLHAADATRQPHLQISHLPVFCMDIIHAGTAPFCMCRLQ